MPTGSKRRSGGHRLSQAVLESLETRTLLTNTAPVLDAITAVSMPAASSTSQLPKTFQVPLTATDADGDRLTYTVTSSNSDITPILHTGDPFLKMTVQFGAGVPEVQTLKGTAPAAAGTFTLSFGGNTTTPLAFNATTDAVQAALRLLSGLDGVVVSGSALTSTSGMIFTVPATAGDVGAITVNTTALTSTAGLAVTETTRGVAGITSEVQTLKGTAAATAGTFTLSFNGGTTTALAFNAATTTVQTALRLLPGLESVVVSGSSLTSTSGMIFTFSAASGNVTSITVNAASITSFGSYALTETTKGIVPGTTGDLWLVLYKEWAPLTVATMTGLIDAGFYDNLIFHRVLKGFMAQGGDPLGTGTGGPGFQFADEFNQNLIFSNRGQLAMANSGDDTNGSQFFITDVATRWLDFNHTIWGQLVRGFDTLDGIVNSPVNSSSTGTPVPAGSLKIVSASIVPDLTDTAITLSARQAGTSTITVTVNDGNGGTSTKTFTVTATADTQNTPAFLKNVPDLYTPVDQPISIPLSAIDLERDALAFNYAVTNPSHATFINNGATLTVVPDKGYTGIITVQLRVSRNVNDSTVTDLWDTDTITIAVGGKPIHARPLGFSAIAGADRTAMAATFTCDDASLDAASFTATINWGDGTAMGTGEIVKSGTLYTVKGTHKYVNAGEYPLTVIVTRTTASVQSGSVAFARSVAKVAAAPAAQATQTIVNAGDPIVGRLNAEFWQWGSVASTSNAVSATVNWGEGTAAVALPLDANGNFRLIHTYNKWGKFYIIITVNDGSGTPVVQRVLASVLKVGPKAAVSGDKSGITGQNRTFYIRPSDTGSNIPAGDYWYSIDWGDGTATQTTTIGTAGLGHRYWKAGTFNATVRIYDPWGGTGATTKYPVTIANAMYQNDPFVSSAKAVFIGGTAGNDKISVAAGTKKGQLVVTVNGKTIKDVFSPTGLLYVWGYDGNDTITVASNVIISGVIYGGAGNDTLTGGGANTILVGGDGNDTIKAATQRSILIGGAGTDKLTGLGTDDILVGGRTAWDDNTDPSAIVFLMREWATTGHDYAARIGYLDGTTTGGLNSGINLEYRTVSSVLQQTVYDDGVVDTLTGGGGSDWFLANQTDVVADAAKKDSITDKAATEQVLNVLT